MMDQFLVQWSSARQCWKLTWFKPIDGINGRVCDSVAITVKFIDN